MGLSSPRAESIDIIALQPAKKLLVIKPMGLSVPWDKSLGIIAFQTAKIN